MFFKLFRQKFYNKKITSKLATLNTWKIKKTLKKKAQINQENSKEIEDQQTKQNATINVLTYFVRKYTVLKGLQANIFE